MCNCLLDHNLSFLCVYKFINNISPSLFEYLPSPNIENALFHFHLLEFSILQLQIQDVISMLFVHQALFETPFFLSVQFVVAGQFYICQDVIYLVHVCSKIVLVLHCQSKLFNGVLTHTSLLLRVRDWLQLRYVLSLALKRGRAVCSHAHLAFIFGSST